MIDFIKKILGFGPSVDYKELLKQGAIIVDVRTPAEFQSGNIHGSINISVETLQNNLSKLKDKSKPIITCCASGMRSGSAKMILKANGYQDVYNGGSWFSLMKKITP
jgi:phage shock protein E